VTKPKAASTVLLIFAHFILIASVALFTWKHEAMQMREYLKSVIPIVLEINFFLIMIALLLNLQLFKTLITTIPRKIWITVIIIAVFGLVLTMFVAPRTHRIFFDEDIYINIGQNMACLNKAGFCINGENSYGEYFCHQFEYNKEPYGWPFLISLVFRLFGVSYLPCFLLNNFIWMFSILLVFLISFILFDNMKAGLFGALIFACIPEGLLWSNTAAIEPSAMFMGGVAVFAVLLFVHNPDHKTLFLCAVLLPFTFQFRPESMMLSLPAFLIVIFHAPRELVNRRTYLFLILFSILISPHIIHLISVRHEDWGATDGLKFSFDFFKNNFRVNALFYIENEKFPVLFTLFFFLGIILPLPHLSQNGGMQHQGKNFHWKAKCIALTWFMLFWGIFLFFYAGNYKYGADVRFSMVSYIPVAVLAGYGVAAVCGKILKATGFRHASTAACILILFCFTGFLPHVRAVAQESCIARADHDFAEEISRKLPLNSLVLTHNPNMFLVWGKNAAQVTFAANDAEMMNYFFQKYTGGVFFHFNFWCTVDDPVQGAFCNEILKKYTTEKIIEHQENGRKFTLYKLKRSNKAKSENKMSGDSFFEQ
jgi:hypothetical protein